MTDSAPIAYPTGGGAYPTKATPVIPAAPVPAANVITDAPATIEPVETEQPKFFALKPVTKVEPLVESELAVEEVAQPEELVFEVHTNELETQLEPDYEFDISSSLTREPQTNAIVLPSIPDVLTSGESLTNAGEIVLTGSIPLPVTGSSDVAEIADETDELDASGAGHASFAPVRAPSVINSKAQLGILPSRRRRSQGQLMAMLTLSIMIITVGALYIMAAALGVLK